MQHIEINRRRVMGGGANELGEPLTFLALEDSVFTLTVGLNIVGQNKIEYIEYSLNKKDWVRTNISGGGYSKIVITTPQISSGNKIYWRGRGQEYGNENTDISSSVFSATGQFEAYGNIMSLLDPETFKDNNTLVASFSQMFMNCQQLKKAPILPSMRLRNYAYINMFSGTSIEETPYLPAENMSNSCYCYMFNRCTYLIKINEIKAKALANACFQGMFQYCTNIEESPILKIETLVERSYYYMFQGCSKLKKITMLATDISAPDCLFNWVYDVGRTGTFIKNPAMTTLPTGGSGIPSGWTVEDYAG